MQGQHYFDSLPLAERLSRQSPEIAERVYSEAVHRYLRDGVVIFPGAIPLDAIDAMDRDLERLTDLSDRVLTNSFAQL